MSTKEVPFRCEFDRCEHHKFRVVSMVAKAEDAGHHCDVVRIPIHKMKECPLVKPKE
jgi:hypothetical protein